MSEETATPLTDKALTRLRALAEGNGLDPTTIELIESVEKDYELSAWLRIEPDVNVKIRPGFGVPKNKNAVAFPSLAALNETIEKERRDIKSKTDWLADAFKEIETIDGHGWGQDGATLFWEKTTTTMVAHEACPSCQGARQKACPTCQGIGTVHCTHCEGRGQEYCLLCQGRGEDPRHPGDACPECRGTRFTPCRFCQPLSGLPGRMPCAQCSMKGSLPCENCRGTGFISQEVELKKCASLSFRLGPTAELPSGLLRFVQKIGDDNLQKHVKISVVRANVEQGEDPLTVKLIATIPYADIKTRFNGKAKMIGVFGKDGRLAGVPPFLDDTLKPARILLVKAARGQEPMDDALQTRALKDSFCLILEGKTHPNFLRRLYPVGLSDSVAKEITTNMILSIRRKTRKARVVSGVIFFALSIGAFAGIFLTPAFQTLTAELPPLVVRIILGIIPFAVLAKGWFVLSRAAQWSLKRHFGGNFSKAVVSARQPIGHIGHALFAALLAAYGSALFLAGLLF